MAEDKTVEVSTSMRFANAKVTGIVTDGFNNDAPLEGASVTLGAYNTVTDAQGKYTFEKLTIDDYVLTVTKPGAAPVSVNLKKGMFKEGIIEVEPLSIGGVEILPGKTLAALKRLNTWNINEYRAGYGRGGDKLDWSVVFMSAYFDFNGNYEMQNEGCTLRIRNSGSEQANPADLVNFDTYTCGRKMITEDNKIMSVNVRTHQADAESPAFWGCQVVDLNAENPTPKMVGKIRKHGDGAYKTYDFDLSDYVGKEVVLAIGIFRPQTGNYFKQLCLGKISFAAESTQGDDYLVGNEVKGLKGWHMTEEHVRSMMPEQMTEFTGLKTVGENLKDHSHPAWHGWYGTNHLMAHWGYMFINYTAEPLADEGFLIKTRSNVPADYDLPESYLYAKFNISAKNDKMILRIRNVVDDVPSVFRVSAITENMKIHHLEPVKHQAVSASAVEGGNGCWKFINNKGVDGKVDDYASFEYDLSRFNGKNVVLTVAIHKGECPDQADEQRIIIHSVDFE